MTEKLYLGYLDGLRGLLAFFILCVHTLPRAWIGDTPQGPLKILAKFMSLGHFAVTAFIVVSGFCLMLPVLRAGTVLRSGPWIFLQRRWVRIGPPLYAAFALSAIILYSIPALYQDRSHITFTNLWAHLTLLQNLVPNGLIANNGVLWSITVEFLIYLWFPGLVLLWQRIGPTWATALYVGLGYLLWAVLLKTPLAPMTMQYLGAFALGALAASIAYAPTQNWCALKVRIPWIIVAAGLVTFVLTAIGSIGRGNVESWMPLFDLLIALAAAAIIIRASDRMPTHTQWFLAQPALVWLGSFSFSLYMVHFPLVDLFCFYLLRPFQGQQYLYFSALILVVMPLVIGFAYLFYLLCERPFHKLARKIGSKSS